MLLVPHNNAHNAADADQATSKRKSLEALVAGNPKVDSVRRISKVQLKPASDDFLGADHRSHFHPLGVKTAEFNPGQRNLLRADPRSGLNRLNDWGIKDGAVAANVGHAS